MLPISQGILFCHFMKEFQIRFHLAGQTQAKVTLPNAASSHLEETETHGTEDAMCHCGIAGLSPSVTAGWRTQSHRPTPVTPKSVPYSEASGGGHRNTSLRVHSICFQHLKAPHTSCHWPLVPAPEEQSPWETEGEASN